MHIHFGYIFEMLGITVLIGVAFGFVLRVTDNWWEKRKAAKLAKALQD
jgi:hypothetical protein